MQLRFRNKKLSATNALLDNNAALFHHIRTNENMFCLKPNKLWILIGSLIASLIDLDQFAPHVWLRQTGCDSSRGGSSSWLGHTHLPADRPVHPPSPLAPGPSVCVRPPALQPISHAPQRRSAGAARPDTCGALGWMIGKEPQETRRE